MPQTIVIVDYAVSNLRSVYRKLGELGVAALVTSKPSDLHKADKIILPGIGHFGQAARNLLDCGLAQALTEQVMGQGKPVLGICLGMQLMMESSEEAPGRRGLGWIKGQAARLQVADARRYKVPHIGWNSVTARKESRLLRGIADGSEFYFTHSYSCLLRDETAVAATTDYSEPFVSVVEQGSLFAVQFHPEKSHAAGSALLENFLKV